MDIQKIEEIVEVLEKDSVKQCARISMLETDLGTSKGFTKFLVIIIVVLGCVLSYQISSVNDLYEDVSKDRVNYTDQIDAINARAFEFENQLGSMKRRMDRALGSPAGARPLGDEPGVDESGMAPMPKLKVKAVSKDSSV